MSIKKISDFSNVNSLDLNDIFLINHLGSTSTVSFSSLNYNIMKNISSTMVKLISAAMNNNNNNGTNPITSTQLGLDIDGEASGDWSGYSVSMNDAGNRVAIGAPYADATGKSDCGHVRVYEYDGSDWTQLGSDIDGEAAGDSSGVSVSMNSAGNRVAIGAPSADATGKTNCGHVRVYEYDGSAWIQLGSDIDGEAAGDRFGFSVSMNDAGNRVAIGARYADATGKTDCGHVRVYEYDGSNWTQLGSDIDGEATDDESGYSVSMNSAGNRVAIGAILVDATGKTGCGHVRVYEYIGSNWTQLGSDIDGEAANDQSGWSVSINSIGDRVAIGAIYADATGKVDCGHVRMYEYDGSTWIQLGLDIDGKTAGDWFGWSVSMNSAGAKVAIGAPIADATGKTNCGHVRVYELT